MPAPPRWDLLPPDVRDQIDARLLRDASLTALGVAMTAGLGLAFTDAVRLVEDRCTALGDRVARTPDDPLDTDSLAARATACPGRLVAVEAVWNGDTRYGWFVVLLVLTDDPPAQHHLATVHWRAATRYLDGTGTPTGTESPSAPHPPSRAATLAGTALAARLGVPFHFASPDEPDDEAPRLRPGDR
ncbi:hypothetical protein ACGFZL_26275 [Streptomyces sp. NPDC048182]|uniref:hypothetical protein n=1 Tax=Streptomyces sp. NPDC048182 TaxID=3365507 RepID=UPI003711C355